LKKGLRIKSAIQIFKVRTCESGITSLQIWICKDSVCAIVLRIREDSINFNKRIYVKVAGFVHKSFSIKTNQVIWYFWSYNW
jgi:hypothetical protein